MPNYTKLFNSIVTSTIWTEDDKTRILWITMLAMSDQNGEVHASIPGLARIAGIDMESTEKAIQCFLTPDPYSRTPDHQGRRITKIEGGWELLNHAKYRKMASKEDSKAATAERVKRHRERNAPVTPCNAPVTPCNAPVTATRDIAEAEAEIKAENSTYPTLPKGRGIYRKVTSDVLDLLRLITGSDANEFHDNAETVFREKWKVSREFVVDDRGDGRIGRVDLVIHHPDGDIGVELDRMSPRQKSIFKLTENFDRWIVLLRGCNDNPRKKRLNPTEKRNTKITANTPTMIQIGAWFGRQPETLWTVAESEALDRCKPTEQELAGMEGYYMAEHGEKDYRRTSVITLLNNWQSELDRAREWWKKSK
jgi:hypothetical protein